MKLSCECGKCITCKHRMHLRTWTLKPGNREKVREKQRRSYKRRVLRDREYNKTRSHKRNLEHKLWCLEYKKYACCISCGYNKCISALDFHHRNPKTKLFNIAKYRTKDKRMQDELDKCDILCANCHRELKTFH